MALALGKLILAGSNATTNTAGAYFSNVVVVSNSSVNTVIAANTGGMFLSDGINVFANSSSNINANVTLITVNGGESANGTFNK